MHEGLFSDHTLQFVDFDQKRLFRNETYTPLSVQERQFTLNNSIKKNAFLKKLYEIHSHQRIGVRVVALAQAFSEEGTTEDLVQRYNRLDYEIRCSILAAANTQARMKFGYQWSPKAKVIFGSKVLGKPLLTQAKSGSFGSKVFFDLRNKY
jgi:hypothetical protein